MANKKSTMIQQNRAIATEIQGKANHYKIPKFVTALDAKEWVEYLIFLLWKDRPTAFSYQGEISFPYQENNEGMPFYTTLAYIQEFLLPEHK